MMRDLSSLFKVVSSYGNGGGLCSLFLCFGQNGFCADPMDGNGKTEDDFRHYVDRSLLYIIKEVYCFIDGVPE